MRQINMNQDWKFLKGDDTSAYLANYNDIYWEEVNLPHCVELAPINCSGGRNYQGLCRYRKTFAIEPIKTKEKLLLEFEGAMQVLEVWVNEVKLDTHYCGYTPAVYDITEIVRYSQENYISVRLDNSDRHDVPPGRPQGRLDFTYEGGITRNVVLHRLPEVHVTNAVQEQIVAGGGLLVTYEDVLEETVKVNVQTHVRNITTTDQSITLQHELFDKDHKSVAKVEESMTMTADHAEHNNMTLKVTKPHLWSPYSPYLYQLKTRILEGDKVIDEVETSAGIRDFEFTTDGFFMNGEKISMSGANYHTTFPHIGNAMPDSLLRRDARKLREAGMLHIRSHYPFPKAFVDECNKLGLALIVCNPGWQYFEEGIFVERAYQNMRDIVRLQRNEPSIIIWEAILNESKDMTASFQKRVGEIVHEELPVGPCYTASDSGLSDIGYKFFDPDMIDPEGVQIHAMKITEDNWEFQVFGEKTDEEDLKIIEEAKALNDSRPRWIREYGDCPDNFTDQNSVWRTPRIWGEDMMLRQTYHVMSGERDSYSKSYTVCHNDDTLCGFGLWPGIEHNRGYHMNPCYGGFLDMQRIPKYSFYLFKSQREPDEMIENIDNGPMVYIANTWSELSPRDITVYSNCEVLRLYHNDELIDEREPGYPDRWQIKHPPVIFKGGFYFGRDRSEIRVEGLIGGKVVAEHKRFSPGVTNKLHMYTDDRGIDMVADGSDIMFVRCEAHDDRGTVVPLTCDNHELIFEVTGEGKIVGDYEKHTELGITGILVQSTKKPGKITVTARFKMPQKNERATIEKGYYEFYSQPMV